VVVGGYERTGEQSGSDNMGNGGIKGDRRDWSENKLSRGNLSEGRRRLGKEECKDGRGGRVGATALLRRVNGGGVEGVKVPNDGRRFEALYL